jgi:hypothetical protein
MNITNKISESLETLFGLKILKFFYADPDPGSKFFYVDLDLESFRPWIRDPFGSGDKHSGSATLFYSKKMSLFWMQGVLCNFWFFNFVFLQQTTHVCTRQVPEEGGNSCLQTGANLHV